MRRAALGSLVKERLLCGIPAALVLCTLILPAAVSAREAVASDVTPVPSSRDDIEAGRKQQRFAVNPKRISIDGDIERGPCPLADPSLSAMKVTFSRVSFGNLTAISPELLDPAWQDLAGREVPIADLCEVRDRAATILRKLGYLAAVQVPPQRIEKNGEVHMDVLVARLVEVQVRGNPGKSENLIAAHLAKLTKRPFFNMREAERHLLLLSALPGYDIRLTLRSAGKAPGEVVGDVLVNRQPVEVAVGTQNLGPRSAGREGAFALVTLNDLTGMGDRTQISLYNTVQTREQTVLRIGHDFAIGSDGLRLSGAFTYGRSKPAIVGGNIRTRTRIGEIELTYPLVLRQDFSLSGALGVEAADQSVTFASTRLSTDKLRIARARLDIDMVDRGSLFSRGGYSPAEPKWRLSASLEARQGLSGLGASHGCAAVGSCLPPTVPISNFLADPSAFVVRFDSSAEYRPVPAITVAIAPRLQYSAKPLLGYEQFSLGNYTIGRGFDPSTLLGDSGAGSSLEFRVGQLRPKSANDMALQPFVFIDAAWAWTNDRGLTNDPQRLVSAGGGIRARWGDHADANLTIAAPLEKAGGQTRRGDVRVLFTLTARLVPWNRK